MFITQEPDSNNWVQTGPKYCRLAIRRKCIAMRPVRRGRNVLTAVLEAVLITFKLEHGYGRNHTAAGPLRFDSSDILEGMLRQARTAS